MLYPFAMGLSQFLLRLAADLQAPISLSTCEPFSRPGTFLHGFYSRALAFLLLPDHSLCKSSLALSRRLLRLLLVRSLLLHLFLTEPPRAACFAKSVAQQLYYVSLLPAWACQTASYRRHSMQILGKYTKQLSKVICITWNKTNRWFIQRVRGMNHL